MNLRNKKTWEIGYFCFANLDNPVLTIMDKNGVQLAKYNSLAKLNEEWEDVPEEPKEYYWIDYDGKVKCFEDLYEWQDKMKQIGNYFETKEEAEKAVEKLKAWKRLKDKGFRFEGWDITDRTTIHNFSLFVAIEDLESINKDLDLLFGGGE